MSDFSPVSDLPDVIDDDDTAIVSGARFRERKVRRRRAIMILFGVVGLGAFLIGLGQNPVRVLMAMAGILILLQVGFMVIGGLARPIPEPPPPGELRKVKITYRCPSCGTELRMTLATNADPQPPRHCADEMEILKTSDPLP